MQCGIKATAISLLLALQGFSAPVISEFMADNVTTATDEDGDFSDWIEIHNPDATPVSLDGWYLTDSAGKLDKWTFPALSLPPGGFLIVWASSKDRRVPGAPLHTNFSLAKAGEFLALVRPDGATKEQEFTPAFPPLATDTSYGSRFDSTTFLSAGATGKYRIPTNAGNPGASWMGVAFPDGSWASGPSGYGFGVELPGINLRQVSKNGSMTGLDDALNLISLPENDPQVLDSRSEIYQTLNLLGDGSDGHYAGNDIYPPGGSDDNFAVVGTGSLTIPTAGTYTFGLNSDDGGCIDIDGVRVMTDDSFHGSEDHFGTITLTAGVHSFQVVMFEGGGGNCLEFFAAPGSRSFFDDAVFRLVGDVANGGLAASTTPPEAGGAVGTDLKTAMSGRSGAFVRMPFSSDGAGSATAMSLVMRYNDGFAAWLNGAPVASANAPALPVWNSVATATRTNQATLRRQGFDVAASLPQLVNGENVLAIHGLNSSTVDADFLVLPELVMGNLNSGLAPAYFGGALATPGWINGVPSSLGKIADTSFSVKRGIFTAPISVAITTPTPGAIIRYTTDGSTPSESHGLVYSGPLAISSTTVLRAVGTLADWESTNVDTQTYLFPDDVLVQSPDGSPYPGWPATSGTSQVLDYGMDPQIVNHANPEIGGPATVKAALIALPTLSITTDLPNLFNIDGSQGIYSNPYNRGFSWERPASVEWINPPDGENPNGTSEFQIDAGLRVRGGFSRSTDNPKHALRLVFRSDYGKSKLEYPLFGPDAAQIFDKIDLRTAQNYSWSFGGDSQNTFLREEACRQAQLDMGQPGSHVRYVQLYLNGRYWGLYDLDERPEAEFSETYLGGKADEYDCIKSEGDVGYTTGATDGNLDAWQELYNKAKICRSSPTNANFFKMMGLSADGLTPSADPVLLDADNLIDYMLITFWSGNLDGCVSNFLGNDKANNWFGSRRRENNPGEGFRFFVHDFEHALFNVNEDRTGPYTSANESNFSYYNPMFIHQDLLGNAEYRLRWADRIHRHMFNDGALTPAAWSDRFGKLSPVVDSAIAAESARWGDAKRATPLTRLDWRNARNDLLTYPSPRNPVVLNQLRADGLYPTVDAPEFTPYGGSRPQGTEVALSGPAGATIYYMPDGSDPRAPGGAVRPGAQIHVANATSETFIPWSASGWSYLGNGSNQGTSWRSGSYDDSAWPVGTAELGYGDNDEATVVPVSDPRPATCYFRRKFTLADASQINNLSVTVNYDDAYAVYLNGVRIAGNLPVDPAYNYYTGSAVEGNPAITTAVSPAVLQEGVNTIAVEVHQSASSSSDLSMNLSLDATRITNASDPLVLQGIGPKVLRARAFSGSVWSALSEVNYLVGTVPATQGNLIVSEIGYRPAAPNGNAEFLELFNTDAVNGIDLSGARFTRGIDYTFPSATTLLPGGRVLLVEDGGAFESLYGPALQFDGVFANSTGLSNTGERLTLESASGEILLDFTYGVDFPWPTSANAGGRSLVFTGGDPSDPSSWRPSAGANGNPGSSDAIPLAPGGDLLGYALSDPAPGFDLGGQTFSVSRRLGADSASLTPEWSTDLGTWQTAPLILISDIPDDAGNSTLTWKLDPLPVGQAFLRVRVTEKP